MAIDNPQNATVDVGDDFQIITIDDNVIPAPPTMTSVDDTGLGTATANWTSVLLADRYEVHRQEFPVGGKTCVNLSAELCGRGRADEIVVVGGHYDSVTGCPGANDNGTGVAATLALARLMRDQEPARTVRFVLFVNEEPPFFQTQFMGSVVYAKGCRQRNENVVAMLSLETIGY